MSSTQFLTPSLQRCNGRGTLLQLAVTRRQRRLCSKLHEAPNASFCCSFAKEYITWLVMLHTTATSRAYLQRSHLMKWLSTPFDWLFSDIAFSTFSAKNTTEFQPCTEILHSLSNTFFLRIIFPLSQNRDLILLKVRNKGIPSQNTQLCWGT